MYDSGRDYWFDKMVEDFEVEEFDRIAMILELNSDKFQIEEDREFIITTMGAESHEGI